MKAVIPAAGFGTRFLPFTKSVPKELIPLLGKPVIQHVVEEARDSGIEDILIVISTGKEAICRHFNPEFELEQRLAATKKDALLEEVRSIGRGLRIQYVYQRELKGLGDAVLCAKQFVGNDPFAILLGDNVTSGPRPVLSELIEVFQKKHSFVVAVEEVPPERTNKYGIIGGTPEGDGVYNLHTLVEKPDPAEAPSNLAIASRYVFPAAIMDCIERTPPGRNNEIQLTDAMRLLLKEQGGCALQIKGKRHDAGDLKSYLSATLEFAWHDAALRSAILKKIAELEESHGSR